GGGEKGGAGVWGGGEGGRREVRDCRGGERRRVGARGGPEGSGGGEGVAQATEHPQEVCHGASSFSRLRAMTGPRRSGRRGSERPSRYYAMAARRVRRRVRGWPWPLQGARASARRFESRGAVE